MSFTDPISEPAVEGYDELGIILDVATLTQRALDYLEATIPNYTSSPGNIETIMLEAAGQMAGDLAQQAAVLPPEAMIYLGETVFNIPMKLGSTAIGAATMTFAADTPAVTVLADSELTVPHPSGEQILFLTDRDVVAPAGGGTVDLQVIAAEAGANATGAFGTGEFIEVIDGLDSIVVQPTTGGEDPETADEYLDRLTLLLTILTPRPILPNDHAIMALQVPGVGRAGVIDLYQPGTNDNNATLSLMVEGAPVNTGAGLSNVPRCTTLIITAEDGVAPTQTLMHDVWESLEAQREINFLVYVIPPTYTSIDVKATVIPYPGFSQAEAIANTKAVLTDWLSPATWGVVPGQIQAKSWAIDTNVRFYEAIEMINRADGVWYCRDVWIKKTVDATWLQTDIVLTGKGPLTEAGDFSQIIGAAS